jgi:flagellin
MSSILTNPSALSALQSLQQTQKDLATTQGEVSTGLAVATAADNASYWSIATHLTADSGVITAANSALTQSQSVMDTASSAISSIITTINSIQAALTQAGNPGADLPDLNTTLASLGAQLTGEVGSASFNGLNLLNGSAGTVTAGTAGAAGVAGTPATATLSFISGFDATTTGGTFATVSFTTLALTGTGGILTNAGDGTANNYDLTNLGTGANAVTATNAQSMSTAVSNALSAVTSYASTIGAAQDAMTAASTFNSALTTNYAEGVSGLVDANMNTASTRLQALQTQEQLGIQSLSIANQNSQLILKLFG